MSAVWPHRKPTPCGRHLSLWSVQRAKDHHAKEQRGRAANKQDCICNEGAGFREVVLQKAPHGANGVERFVLLRGPAGTVFDDRCFTSNISPVIRCALAKAPRQNAK